ncbi:hypothetical protein [Paenibacillus amylolyticus]|uniref:hypothetical protein n=1 Tax=Paenibacillus amylolyticus TaxID=1451 RepID=UPI00201DB084|nr:hypothetical protein [Paenibacillus amylolyticus]MCL6663402.1 hypothetical protein [Paenibacillus amylolyticus]
MLTVFLRFMPQTFFFANSILGAALVVNDGNHFKPGWKVLSSRTAAITDEEHSIAYRVGWIDANNNGKVDVGVDVVDFHFMLQNSTGKWSVKHK